MATRSSRAERAKELDSYTPEERAKIAAAHAKLAPNLGNRIDSLVKQRDAIREAEAKLNEMKESFKAAETTLIETIEAQNIDGARGKLATASVSFSEVHTIDDYDAFAAYVAKHKYYHLFQRRLSEPAVRELEEKMKGQKLPGLGAFTHKKLNLRAVK